MEAKDTVMEVQAIRELFKERPKIKTMADLHGMFQQLAEAQAEISFKAGIGEVIKRIEDNAGETLFLLEDLVFWKELKEWVVDKPK